MMSRTTKGHVPKALRGQRDRTTPALGGVVPCPQPVSANERSGMYRWSAFPKSPRTQGTSPAVSRHADGGLVDLLESLVVPALLERFLIEHNLAAPMPLRPAV